MPQRAGVKGFTLTELGIVIGIIGLLLSAIWTAAGNAYSSKKAQQATNQITQLVNGYRTLYSQHNVDVGNNTDVTCTGVNAGLFPQEMITTATSTFCSKNPTSPITQATAPQTPWGGISYVQVTAMQAPPGVKIFYKNLTSEQCNYLANLITFAPDVIWENISGNAQWISVGGSSPPYTISAINSYCSSTNKATVGVMYKAK